MSQVRRAITTRDLPQIALARCTCGVRRRPEAQIEGLAYTLTCPRCNRVTSGFTWEETTSHWNGQPLQRQEPQRFVPSGPRLDFEADHPGPFDHVNDAAGNELEEYANPRTQSDWLLWLRAQAAAENSLVREIDRLNTELNRLTALQEVA